MTPIRTKQDFERATTPTLLRVRFGGVALPEEVRTDVGRSAMGFLRDARQAFVDVGAANFRILEDQTMNRAQQLVKSASVASARLKSVKQRFESFWNGAASELDSKWSDLSKHFEPHSLNMGKALIDDRLREIVRTEPDPAKQMAHLNAPEFRAAVARGPRSLSGLAEQNYNTARRGFLQDVAPDELAAYDEGTALLKAASDAYDQFNTDVKTMVDFEGAAAVEGRRYVEPTA